MSKVVRAGIIGFGRMAETRHLPGLREAGRYEVVGVCDITEKRRQVAETTYGLRATGDLAEFLKWDLDLVVIATHSSQHYQDAMQCLAARKHLLIEKPIALTGAEAAEMVATAKANGVTLTVYHNRHFDADYRMVKWSVQEGLLGDLVTFENRSSGKAPAVGFGTADFQPTWRITAAQGGGTMLDFGPHWVEQCLDLMSGHQVVQVFADVRHVKWGDVDDLFKIDMIFSNGVRATAGKIDISYWPWPMKWYIAGTKATLHGPVDNQMIINGHEFELRQDQMVEAFNLHENIAAHLLDGAPLIITGEHALRVMQVLQAARDSAAAGRSVDARI